MPLPYCGPRRHPEIRTVRSAKTTQSQHSLKFPPPLSRRCVAVVQPLRRPRFKDVRAGPNFPKPIILRYLPHAVYTVPPWDFFALNGCRERIAWVIRPNCHGAHLLTIGLSGRLLDDRHQATPGTYPSADVRGPASRSITIPLTSSTSGFAAVIPGWLYCRISTFMRQREPDSQNE